MRFCPSALFLSLTLGCAFVFVSPPCPASPQHREQTGPEEEFAVPELQVVPGERLSRAQVPAPPSEPLLACQERCEGWQFPGSSIAQLLGLESRARPEVMLSPRPAPSAVGGSRVSPRCLVPGCSPPPLAECPCHPQNPVSTSPAAGVTQPRSSWFSSLCGFPPESPAIPPSRRAVSDRGRSASSLKGRKTQTPTTSG